MVPTLLPVIEIMNHQFNSKVKEMNILNLPLDEIFSREG
jgi:hypothetical protein